MANFLETYPTNNSSNSVIPIVQEPNMSLKLGTLPNELLIEIFKHLDLKAHKAINLTSKRISQLSFCKQIPVISSILEGENTQEDLILPYLKYFEEQVAKKLLKKANTSFEQLLKPFIKTPTLLTRQSAALLCKFIKLRPTYFCADKIFSLPYQATFPHKDATELRALQDWLQISTSSCIPDYEEITSFLETIEHSPYLNLLDMEHKKIWVPLFIYLMDEPELLESSYSLLKFLKILHEIDLRLFFRNPEIRLYNNIRYYLEELGSMVLDEFLSSALEIFGGDRDVAFAIVKISGSHLEYLPSYFKNDKEMVLAAVMNDGLALEFADSKFKNDKEVVLAAIKRSKGAFEFTSPKLKEDLEVIEAAKSTPYFSSMFLTSSTLPRKEFYCDNLANNTQVGFKKSDPDFQNLLYQVLPEPTKKTINLQTSSSYHK